jgi:hypothetical protein
MCIPAILVMLSLTAVYTVKSDSPIGNGKCITIMKDNWIFYEIPVGWKWAGYLYSTRKDPKQDNQKWILENTYKYFYKLINKQSNKTVEVHTHEVLFAGTEYLKTTDKPRHDFEFSFRAHSGSEYEILARPDNRPTRVTKKGYIWVPSYGESDLFQIQSCT